VGSRLLQCVFELGCCVHVGASLGCDDQAPVCGGANAQVPHGQVGRPSPPGHGEIGERVAWCRWWLWLASAESHLSSQIAPVCTSWCHVPEWSSSHVHR